MDLTTLTYAPFLEGGLLGVDAAMHPPRVIRDAQTMGMAKATKMQLAAYALQAQPASLGRTRSSSGCSPRLEPPKSYSAPPI